MELQGQRRPHFGGDGATSSWKRGSFRSGSNIGSSRSRAGVSGAAVSVSTGIDSSFRKAAMARSGSPICAATAARTWIGAGPLTASFSIGFAAIARSARANAAALSPRPIFVSARAPSRLKFSGCSSRNDSSSARAQQQHPDNGEIEDPPGGALNRSRPYRIEIFRPHYSFGGEFVEPGE
jgi:hypothetical protein